MSKVFISCDVGEHHLDFETEMHAGNKLKGIFSNGLFLRFRKPVCSNFVLRYENKASGRVHIWKDFDLIPKDDMYYEVINSSESMLLNKRGAFRVPINAKSKCTISDIAGEQDCEIHDLSVTGIGIYLWSQVEGPNLQNRIFKVTLKDEVTGGSFFIVATCVQVTYIDDHTYLCGCKIIQSTPSINGYVNLLQVRTLMRSTNRKEVAL